MIEKKGEQVKALALKLYEINAFKFGDFKMKVGINSPVYFDLRVIVSYPKVMKTVADLIGDYINEHKLTANHVCGVPYTALPLATIVSIQQNFPMLVRRKEIKSYGTKKLIEGLYKSGDKCLIIEDVVTSGSSVLDTVTDLKSEGILVSDAVVVVDRGQGGGNNIARHGVRMHSLFTLSQLLDILLEAGKIQEDTAQVVTKYINDVQIDEKGNSLEKKKNENGSPVRWKMSFQARANLAKCEVAKDLFNLMASKHTNLCLAADVTQCARLLELAEKCGPYICLLKTHVDILEDFNENFVQNLQALAKRFRFLIMEDRKYADIGNTVSLQYSKGVNKISTWADLVTAHTVTGRSVLQGLKAGLENGDINKKRGVFLIAEMSSGGNLIDEYYKELSVKMAVEGSDIDFVAGIVCQTRECFAFPGLIQLTPGIKIDDNSDELGQIYQIPHNVVQEKGADIGVVGRGILQAKCPIKAAAKYRDYLWAAYTARLDESQT